MADPGFPGRGMGANSRDGCNLLLCRKCMKTKELGPVGEGAGVITVHKRSCGKVMFSQACVKTSVHGGGVDRVHNPPGQTPPWVDTPTTAPSRQSLQRTVHILLECILVSL